MNGFRSRGVGGGFLGGLFSGGGGAHDDAQQLNQDAVVNNRRYVLSDSNAERLGPNGDGRREEEEPRDISEIDSQAATSTSYQGASLSEIDSRASTETTAQSTDASSSEEATANSFVSGLGCLTSWSGGSDQGYGYDLEDDDDDDSNGPPPSLLPELLWCKVRSMVLVLVFPPSQTKMQPTSTTRRWQARALVGV